MKYFKYLCFFIVVNVMFSCSSGDYMDASLPIKKRVELLMSQMTIEEKIAQMEQCAIWDKDDVLKGKLYENAGFGAWICEVDPSLYNELQSYSEKSRLKIPYLFGCDAPHGHAIIPGRTVFPTSISMAATFNPDLVYQCAVESAKEIRATGTHWTYSPCLDIVTDARWGRTGETYGECPFLTSAMAVANVRGLQGDLGENNVIACAKHLYGGGMSVGGVNHGNAEISERMARNVILRPFKAAVDAGLLTIMPGHNDVNGIPCHANKWLLTDLVKKEWGFNGFYITDMGDIENLLESHFHRTALTQREAVKQAISAGIDLHMYSKDKEQFIDNLLDLYNSGEINKSRIDDACRRILTVKFQLGLFENRYIKDVKSKSSEYGSPAALQLALDAARQNIVLLKNNGLLPLNTEKYRKILVTGPNADNQSIDGDWSNPQPDSLIHTVLEGIRSEVDAEINYVPCGRIKGDNSNLKIISTTDPKTQSPAYNPSREINDFDIDRAVSELKKCDLCIAVIGGYGLRYDWGMRTYGESADRPSIDFYGRQVEMVKKLIETGKDVIVVIVNGKPLNNHWITQNAEAIIDAWEPGMFGGTAVGEIIAGKINPSGKLPITIPKYTGQIPMYYYQTKSRYATGYYYGSSSDDDYPEFCFGHGLSYSSFVCNDEQPSDSLVCDNEPYSLKVKVKNSGNMAGYTTVMSFLSDEVSSVVTPQWMLCGFKKVWLEKGEEKVVEILIPFDSFKLWNEDMKFVAEPGVFNVKVGFSFDDTQFKKRLKYE